MSRISFKTTSYTHFQLQNTDNLKIGAVNFLSCYQHSGIFLTKNVVFGISYNICDGTLNDMYLRNWDDENYGPGKRESGKQY